MMPFLRIVSVFATVFTLTFPAFGQTQNEIWSDAELNRFIEIRWLSGSIENQFENQFKTLSDQVFKAIEQQRGKPFSKEIAEKLRNQLTAIAIEAQQSKPAGEELQDQYNIWRRCIAESYKSKLNRTTQSKILAYYKAGAFQYFTGLQTHVSPWILEAFNRAKGITPRLLDQAALERLKTDKDFETQLQELLGTYLVLDTAFPKLMAIQSQYGYQAYSATLMEVNMAALNLPAIAKALGMTEGQFAALKAYASLDSDAEFKIFESCMYVGSASSDSAAQKTPFVVWIQGFVSDLMKFAQDNEAQLK